VSKHGTQVSGSHGASCVKSASGATNDVAMVAAQNANQELSAEMFRQAVEACSCGMVLIDGAGKIMMVNTRTERLFGYPREELIGQLADIIVPARLRARHAQCMADFIMYPESHTGSGVDLFGRRKDGTEFHADVSLNPIDSAKGLLVLTVIIDLTERDRADQLKDEFVATVSHELRTPLTSIAGALGLLAGDATGNLPDPAARLIAIAHTNCQRLVRLINDILDIGKMELGQIVFDLKRVEVLSLVEQAIEANRGFADSYDVTIQLDAASEKGEVCADHDRLVQVVTNLLSNAIKFSPRGEKVIIGTEKRGDVVRISVRDHGLGIPDGFKPRVFEKFAQADASDTRQKGGSGLGLSILKTIVERLGGTVAFDDAPGGGTIFQVELPDFNDGPGGTEFELDSADANASGSVSARSA
jgi:PAS domain S-box-containing protein